MNGLYISGMGMISGQNNIKANANNIANISTNGYKFDSMVSSVFENKNAFRKEENRDFIGEYANKVNEVGTYINLKSGSLETVENSLSAALMDGSKKEASFFVVQSGNRQLLTRNGDFEINEDRTLRTSTGEFVLDVNNNKIIVPEELNVTIMRNGSIQDSNSGQILATLQRKKIDETNRESLVKEENAMFSLTGGRITELPNSDVEVASNTIEKSNVDMSKEMIDLMNAQKKFQASQKAFTSFDKIYEKEANQLMK